MIVECETTEQKDRTLKIGSFGRADIVCFSMRDRPTVKGVISGVPIDVECYDSKSSNVSITKWTKLP